MILPKPAPVTECCGARVQTWQNGPGEHETWCRDCDEQLCSGCAASWEVDGGYGDDGSQVRIFARCANCQAEANDKRERREWRNDSGV